MAQCKAVIKRHDAASLAMTQIPLYWRMLCQWQICKSREYFQHPVETISAHLLWHILICHASKCLKERFEDVLCTGDGNGAAASWKVKGGSACGIVQAFNILKVGGPLPLCQTERMLSSSTLASGLHVDILRYVPVTLHKVPVPACQGLHPESLKPEQKNLQAYWRRLDKKLSLFKATETILAKGL